MAVEINDGPDVAICFNCKKCRLYLRRDHSRMATQVSGMEGLFVRQSMEAAVTI